MYCNSYVEYSCSTGHNLKGNARRTCKGDQRWSGSQPRCELVNCGNPGNPKNGRTIAQHGYTYAQDILFECDDGYFMEGQSIATCQLNGRWSKDLPKCLEKCSDPKQQTNAQIIGKEFYHGKKVKFGCPWRNYILEPQKSRTLTCRNGKWTGRIPHCKAPCKKLASIRSGRTYSRSLKHGSRVSFKCNNGYKMIGSSVIQCSNGKWSNSIPKCLAICSIINKFKNGWIYGKGNNEGDKLSFDCLQNYVLDGEKTITCKADRRWSSRTPKCRAPCKQIKGLLYGSITRQGFKHNEEVHFKCNQDYVFEGSRIILCNDRKWSDSPPVCFAPCKKFPSNPFPKGYIKKDGFRHNEVVVFGCRDSFVIDGRAQLKCINGSWDERQPICGAPCKPLPPPANGKILGSGYRHKEKTTFACNKGYGLVGGKERLCNLGRWSGNIPQCKLVHCGDPGNPKNGRTIAKDGFSYGHKISFVCDKGYVLKGNLVATCQDNGNWSDVLPQCLEICRDPMQQTNAQIIGSKFYHGQQVTFICSGKNYVIDPSQSSTLTCQNGKWNGSIPQCKAPCSTLRKIRNGSMKVTSRTHGSKALFSCNKGYKMNGTFSSQCNDGNWTAPIPNCVVVNCGDPGHPKNGTAAADDGFTYGRDVRFKCNKGYSLVGKNSATCQSNGNWSRDVPFCLIMQMPEDDDIQNAKRVCFDPRKQTNARVSGREFIHGKQVKFQCKRRGYVLDPGQSATLTCQYGKWSGPIPQCKAVDCGYPGNPKNGRTIAINGFTFRQRVSFKCDKDHYRLGSTSAYCQYNGKWSRKLPKCFAPCTRLDVANIRTKFIGPVRHRSWTLVSCKPSYRRSGQLYIRCMDGNWEGTLPKCLAPCKDIPPPKNGKIVYKSTRHGGRIIFQCNWPTTLHGANTLTCENGSWSVPPPSCI